MSIENYIDMHIYYLFVQWVFDFKWTRYLDSWKTGWQRQRNIWNGTQNFDNRKNIHLSCAPPYQCFLCKRRTLSENNLHASLQLKLLVLCSCTLQNLLQNINNYDIKKCDADIEQAQTQQHKSQNFSEYNQGSHPSKYTTSIFWYIFYAMMFFTTVSLQVT